MSLIVTSSADVDETNQLGISIPYQYRNNIKNPLEVPPNSEVAVESVKIQRTPMLDYGNNITTNFWFGERLASDTAKDSQTSYFIPVDNTILGSKSPQDFAEEFKKLLQEAYSLHPEIDSESIEVNIHLDSTTNQFAGFQYKIPQVGAEATVSTIPPDDTKLQEISNVGGTYSGGTFEADEGGDCFLQLQPQNDQGGPISLHNGSLVYTDVDETTTGCFGLSRPYCNNVGRGGEIQGWEDVDMIGDQAGDHPFGDAVNGEGLGTYGDVYMDYCVQNNGTDIKVFNYGNKIGYGQMREVVYYQKNAGENAINNGSNSSFATGTPIPSASMGDIAFEFENEKLTISVSGNTIVSIVDFSSASFKNQIPLPTSIANWKMYPTVWFEDQGDDISIDTYECRTDSTITNNYPENSWVTKSKIATFIDGRGTAKQDATTHPDLAKTPAWNNANWWEQELYERRIFIELAEEKSAYTAGSIRNYNGIQNNLLGVSGRRYENIYIMGQNDRYVNSRVEGWQANSALTLGFSPFSINQDSGITHSGGYHGASFVSVAPPSLSSQQSTFIRVPTLTHETYNFNTGNPSKILFQIPRFDNSGAETGALYFQNSDKTFIDLKNAAPLRITDMDVHLVRKDETFAKDLTGSTEVVFVIRQKQKL
jgi:hypothetical protein